MSKCVFVLVVILVFIEKNSCSYLRSCTEPKIVNNTTEYIEIRPPLVYHDVESVLKLLQQPQHKATVAIQQLLDYYYTAKAKKAQFDASGGTKKYPLIVLEGLSGSGKTTIANVLSKKLNGTQFHSPPRAVQKLGIRKTLRSNPLLDTAYHALAHYISSLEVVQLLRDSPVVMDRYWQSSASYGIAFAINNYPEKYQMPPKGDKIYNWPEDMLQPDIVLLLDVNETVRNLRIWGRDQIAVNNAQSPPAQSPNPQSVFHRPDGLGHFINKCPEFRINLIQAYKNMQNPVVTVINGDNSISTVLKDIYSKIQGLFPNTNFN